MMGTETLQGGTDTMQGVGGQTLCKGWRINIIQGGDEHFTRMGDGHYNNGSQTL